VSTPREELLKLIESQPEDSTLDEITKALAFHLMVLRGLADADAGRVISDEEMAQRIKSWAE
jgi:predicted transcriptional regulator